MFARKEGRSDTGMIPPPRIIPTIDKPDTKREAFLPTRTNRSTVSELINIDIAKIGNGLIFTEHSVTYELVIKKSIVAVISKIDK